MQFIAQTGPRGLVVQANATRLSADLDSSAQDFYVQYDIFANSAVVTIGEEDIAIGTHGTHSTGCTRGANSTTPAAHKSGQNVRLAPGTELLSKTFNGSTYLSAIRCGGDVEGIFAVQVDGTIKYIAHTTPYQLELVFPMARCQPANNTVIKVLVWLVKHADNPLDEAVFFAEMQS
jgi:hypothetical protein